MTLFDSAMHPTLTGDWIDGRKGMTFEDAQHVLVRGEITRACAIGLPGVGSYQHEKYFDSAIQVPGLVPVAAVTSRDPSQWRKELSLIRDIGFRAVKFHPRLLNLNSSTELLVHLLGECSRARLTLFYCTFFATEAAQMPREDPLWSMVRAIGTFPESRVVMMHGGVHRLFDYAEAFRYCPNVLVDLSFTMVRFPYSRLRSDVIHVLSTLDQQACIGSDSPDVDLDQWMMTLSALQNQVDTDRWNRIASENLSRFLDV